MRELNRNIASIRFATKSNNCTGDDRKESCRGKCEKHKRIHMKRANGGDLGWWMRRSGCIQDSQAGGRERETRNETRQNNKSMNATIAQSSIARLASATLI